MKHTLIAVLMVVAAVTATPLSNIYRIALDTTEVVAKNFAPYNAGVTRLLIDSTSPTNYDIHVHDTLHLNIAPTTLRYSNQGGWSLLTWVKFDDQILTNTKNIPIFDCMNNFRMSLSASGKQIFFQTDDTLDNQNPVNQDSAYPYTFKSDSITSLFDGYYHLVSVAYTDATNKYLVCVDGVVIADQSPNAGVAVRSPLPNTYWYNAGCYKVSSSQGTWYRGPAGLYMAGFQLLSRPMTAAAHKTHYDTTIAHAYRQKPISAVETSTAAAAEYSLTCYPNPITSSATISVTLPSTQQISIKLYDIRGSLIQTLFTGTTASKLLSLPIENLSKGVYLIKVKMNNDNLTKKVLLIK